MFETPILLIIFNRFEAARKVFEKIRDIKPRELYISSDGPRTYVPNEEEVVTGIRKYIKDHIDWECNLHAKFNSENMGCGMGPYSAITWAFENTEKLIILEDDCIPSKPFFPYCEELLKKYEKDERIWIISGLNHFEGAYNFNNQDSYFFSKYASPWGWATWKRCWKEMDIQMSKWELFNKQGFIFDHVNRKDNQAALAIYSNYYQKILKKVPSTIWDIQFGFTIWSNRGVGIIPAMNLITNIGLEGTHSFGEGGIGHNLEADEEFSIKKHPDFFQTNFLFDDMYYKLVRKKKKFHFRLMSKGIRIFKKLFKYHF